MGFFSNPNTPLGMPPGSVGALLAILTISVALAVEGMLSLHTMGTSVFITNIAFGFAGFYIGKQSTNGGPPSAPPPILLSE